MPESNETLVQGTLEEALSKVEESPSKPKEALPIKIFPPEDPMEAVHGPAAPYLESRKRQRVK